MRVATIEALASNWQNMVVPIFKVHTHVHVSYVQIFRLALTIKKLSYIRMYQ